VKIFGGESFVSVTARNPVLIDESARLAEALNLVGHNTIQCFLDGGQVKFIEVNPRYGGGANLGFAAGVPTPDFLVRILKGELVEPCVGEFKDRYVMLRYSEDMFMDEASLTEGRL